MYTTNRIGDIMILVKESGTQGLKAKEQAAWPAWSPALPLPLALPHGPFGPFGLSVPRDTAPHASPTPRGMKQPPPGSRRGMSREGPPGRWSWPPRAPRPAPAGTHAEPRLAGPNAPRSARRTAGAQTRRVARALSPRRCRQVPGNCDFRRNDAPRHQC